MDTLDTFKEDLIEYLNSSIKKGWKAVQITSYNENNTGNGINRFNVQYVVKNGIGTLVNANALVDFNKVRCFKIKQRVEIINRIKAKIKNG